MDKSFSKLTVKIQYKIMKNMRNEHRSYYRMTMARIEKKHLIQMLTAYKLN